MASNKAFLLLALSLVALVLVVTASRDLATTSSTVKENGNASDVGSAVDANLVSVAPSPGTKLPEGCRFGFCKVNRFDGWSIECCPTHAGEAVDSEKP